VLQTLGQSNATPLGGQIIMNEVSHLFDPYQLLIIMSENFTLSKKKGCINFSFP